MVMSLPSVIKSALTIFLGDSLSTSIDGLFWDEVCSTFSDPLFASKLQPDKDDLGNLEKFKDAERINGRLLAEKRQLVNNTRHLRADNTALKNRVAFLESELARLAAALNFDQGRESSSLQSELKLERKHREELLEENKRYKQKLQESERVIKMLTTQRKPFMEVERQNEKSDDCGCTSPRRGRHIQQHHPFDEMWQLH